MSWIDFNRDGEVDTLEMFLAEELLCSSEEDHEVFFEGTGDYDDDDWGDEDE